jgi:hypothetical protein
MCRPVVGSVRRCRTLYLMMTNVFDGNGYVLDIATSYAKTIRNILQGFLNVEDWIYCEVSSYWFTKKTLMVDW